MSAEFMTTSAGGQPIIILKEGTERSRGKDAQKSNIMAARVVAESVRSSLGPKGMDKMLVDGFGDVTITNDGATILKEMDVQHPTAKMMVEVAKAQDDEVGDGTTSSVVLTGELLNKAEELMDKGVHPIILIDGYRKASEQALKLLDEISIKVDPVDKNVLKKIAIVSQISKLLSDHADFIANIAVDAILSVSEKTPEGYVADVDDVKVERKTGESLTETRLIKGLILDKEIVHPGMSKRVENSKIALLNCPLEIEKTEFDAKINIQSPEQMNAFLQEEENLLKNMVDKIAATGANIVFCQKGIDDMVQHFLAKKGISAVRRASEKDMEKLSRATGGRLVTNIDDLSSKDLGAAGIVEERKIGDDEMIFVEKCKNPKAVTILIRGGTDRITSEAERSIHDALCVVRDVVRDPRIVAGGGAVEVEISNRLENWAEKESGREQLAIKAFAEALEIIPTTLAENAGLDTIDTMVNLSSAHEKGEKWAGIDLFDGKVKDTYKMGVYEPASVKEQAIKSASEAVTMILKIDDVIAGTKSGGTPPPTGPPEGMGGSEFD
jgi:thermosome